MVVFCGNILRELYDVMLPVAVNGTTMSAAGTRSRQHVVIAAFCNFSSLL